MIYKFCHIPKTGGVSICNALGKKVTGHQVMKKQKDIFLYAFVRNPLDRLVSSFFYLKHGGRNKYDKMDVETYNISKLNFYDFVLQELDKASKKQTHFLPQHHWIPDGVDFLGRFETIQEDFNFLLTEIMGRKPKKLPLTNQSKHKNYLNYFRNKIVLEKVQNIYQIDFEKYYD